MIEGVEVKVGGHAIMQARLMEEIRDGYPDVFAMRLMALTMK